MTLRDIPEAIRKTDVRTTEGWQQTGITPAQMRTLIRAGYLVRSRRGVYATKAAVDSAHGQPGPVHALRVAAALAATKPDAVASHHSAARIHGLDMLEPPPEETVTLTRRPPGRSTTREQAGIVFHCAQLPEHHVTRVRGVPVTTVTRTVVDVARVSSFRAGVALADSALRLDLTSKPELGAVLRTCTQWPGIDRARRVVAFSSGLAESVLESCARVIFDEQGLEPPELQAGIRGDGFVAWADFCWPEHKTLAEADGLAKYSRRQDMLDQFRRDRQLRDAGYRVVHFTWQEIFSTPELVVARIRDAFAAATAH